MHVCTIDQASGLADGQSTTGAFVTDAPFGGRIQLTGWINNPPNRFVVPPAQWFRYRIRARQLPSGTWETIDNDFTVWVTAQNGPLSVPTASQVLQSTDASGFYPYLEHVNGSQYHRVTGDVLAQWLSQPRTGQWEIALDVKLPDGSIHPAGTIVCPDGTTRSTVRVRLDQQPTSALVAITGFSTTENGPINPAANCGFFTPGLWIHGTYEAVDADGHFRRLTLGVDPAAPANGARVDPPSRAYPTVSTNGEAGTWKLDTDGMDPCGYVIRLHTGDRTIANNSPNGWHNAASVGFCLEQPES